LQSAVEEAERLIPVEPNNSTWIGSSANAHLELARSLLALDRRDEAAQQVMAGCAAVSSLRARDPAAARTRSLQTLCLTMRARVALAHGDVAGAKDYAKRSLAAARSEQGEDRIADRYSAAAAYRLLGDINQRSGDNGAAQAAWKSGLDLLPRDVRERPLEKNERAELLRRLGRMNDARPILSELAAIGYKGNS